MRAVVSSPSVAEPSSTPPILSNAVSRSPSGRNGSEPTMAQASIPAEGRDNVNTGSSNVNVSTRSGNRRA